MKKLFDQSKVIILWHLVQVLMQKCSNMFISRCQCVKEATHRMCDLFSQGHIETGLKRKSFHCHRWTVQHNVLRNTRMMMNQNMAWDLTARQQFLLDFLFHLSNCFFRFSHQDYGPSISAASRLPFLASFASLILAGPVKLSLLASSGSRSSACVIHSKYPRRSS